MKNDYGTLARHKWALPFEFVMAGGAVVTFLQHDWLHLAASLFTLTVSFAPLLLERLIRVRLPAFLQVTYVAFIFLSMFSGEVFDMYARIWEWDDGIHFASGLLIGLGGVIWMSALSSSLKTVKIPTWLQSLFVFCIVTAVIVLWELVEFGSDQLFGTTSQGSLFDTMMDLLYGAGGGLIVSILLVLHLAGRKVSVLDAAIRSYAKLNR